MSDEHSPDEVSGQAAFWILASLAAAAVVLPSTSSRNKGRDLFGGNIDLVRCIPGVCLLDGTIDTIYLCVSAYKALTSPEPTKPKRHATIIAAKLVLAIFTVFPQIIKAFSLKGVPATQICAFAFFFAFVTRLLIDLCGLEWEEPYTPPENDEDTSEIVVLISILLQFPFEVWIWHNISRSVSNFQLSEGLSLFLTITSLFCAFSMILQGLIWLAFVITRRRFDISATPHIVPMRLFWVVLMVLSLTERQERRKTSETESGLPPPPEFMRVFLQATTLLILTALSSLAVAKVLDVISKLLSAHARTKDASTQTEQCGTEGTKEDGKEPEESSSVPKGSFVGRLGVVVDHWVVQCLALHSTASICITLTVFNLITTVMYYLVYFDGTGTVNPDWTSVLG
ncbi:uncharacterized protein B0J16DRAFT_47156 [Fusarium flagelliforme]|uniref:uncharacterized protein n=1 Tax=Fusarium flagelliforme TaxID=2675880 RepID=UPI001E8D0F0C|nr:uncharacterized protein B0J16DRAFT_47156 [Fusarium flagelliforme]KAH7198864.1 hypothetical protein B0J16DRAFT_47156 [Fusarium flagelliforme]